jgi:ubiquinone/menaquinone biosynthesis C-methylase UbiE
MKKNFQLIIQKTALGSCSFFLIICLSSLSCPAFSGGVQTECSPEHFLLAPQTNDSTRYATLAYQIEHESREVLPFTLPESLLPDLAKQNRITLNMRTGSNAAKTSWTIFFEGIPIGALTYIRNAKTCETRLLSEAAYTGQKQALLKALCQAHRTLRDQQEKVLEQKRSAASQEPAIPDVALLYQRIVTQYPSSEPEESGVKGVNRSLGIDLVKLFQGVQAESGEGHFNLQNPFQTLDVGSGKGSLLIGMKSAFSSGVYHWTGVSPEPEELVPNQGIGHFRGYAENLPEAWSDRFQFITCFQVLHLMADPLRALEEIFRVLAPGGMAVIDIRDVIIYLNDNRNPEQNWLLQNLPLYLAQAGIPFSHDEKHFILRKPAYSLPLVFTMEYAGPEYYTYAAAEVKQTILRMTGGLPVDFRKLISPLTLHIGAQYRTFPKGDKTPALSSLVSSVKIRQSRLLRLVPSSS